MGLVETGRLPVGPSLSISVAVRGVNQALELVMGAYSVRLSLLDTAPGPKRCQTDVVAALRLVTLSVGAG